MGTYPVPMSVVLDDDFRMPLVSSGEKCLQRDKFIFFGLIYSHCTVGISSTNKNLPFCGLQSVFGRMLFMHNKYCTLTVLPVLLHDE